jgi:hypothetical protein
MNRFGLDFAPLVPWPVIIGLAAVALIVAGVALFARQRGALVRALAFTLILMALVNPSLTNEEREKLNDVVALVVDRSGSQSLSERADQTAAARQALEAQLRARPRTDLRIVEVEDRAEDADGTRLFESLQAAVGDVPPDRLAGVIAITDGQVHDVPASLRGLGIGAPFHGLVTGRPDERDRRIEIVQAPRFGIVGKEQTVSVRVIDHGAAVSTARLAVRRDGQRLFERPVAVGQVVQLQVTIDHAGPNIVELEVDGLQDELTMLNNVAVVPIEGVRDKLRVLLVSGEPHAGERTWRNLLKSDANVDLVHFTILRPPEKQDGTPISELSLIAFPTRELFVQKISEFDLIIFDRYSNQSILPSMYIENIVRYVRDGGAVLLAAGSEFAQSNGLFSTPLGQILPARPTGAMVERPFLARVAELGRRHPVTRALPGSETDPPSWSPWFRLLQVEPRRGQTIMTGADDRPLLMLHREQKGRVALFLSDHAWLWARGFGEGGPYLDLLRRLAHWLMKEPQLEEEALRLSTRGRQLVIERQTLSDRVGDVRLIAPNGEEFTLTLAQEEPGLWRSNFTARRSGLHRVVDGDRVAFANVGPPNPREFRDVVSTLDVLQAVATETGGSMRRLAGATGGISVPRVVDISSGTRFGGNDYIGLKPTEAHLVRGIGVFPIATGALGLLLLFGAALLTWLREGRFRVRRA